MTSNTVSTVPSLLPSNSTPLEKALEQACAGRCEKLNLNLSALYNADECPVELLPWLAWAYHISGWEKHWSEAQKREAIKQAVLINRKKGTPWAVKTALRLAKIEANLIEWWQKTPEGMPYTFTVDISLNDQSAGIFGKLRTYTRLRHIVGEYKPVRAHYDINMSATLTTGLALATPTEVDASVDSVAETLPVQPRPTETGFVLAAPSEIDAAVDVVAESQPVQPRSVALSLPAVAFYIELCATINLGYSV